MNSSGIVRKIDELGRIVIPMEIRKTLNIKSGDMVNFSISGKNIIIFKSSILDSCYDLLLEINNILGSILDCNYFISDREKIIFSSSDDLVNHSLNSNIIDLLDSSDEYIILDGDDKKYVYPYYIDGSISGFIVLYNVSNFEKYIKLLKYITSYINAKISISWYLSRNIFLL